MVSRLRELYDRNEKTITPVFLALGFLFDIATLDRIDSWFSIAQQAIYLLGIAALVGIEVMEHAGVLSVTTETRPKLSKIWPYRTAAVHFLLGSLLSSYTLFYFKSASFVSSFLFIAILCGLLIANEYSRFQGFGTGLRVAMFSLCLLSYLIYFVPILIGFIGPGPFMLSLVASAGVCYLVYRLLKKRILVEEVLRRQVRLPMLLVHLGFTLLYFARVLPPVPLSISYMGIYHDVKKLEGKYHLSYTRSKWRFWERGDQSFAYRPGDQIVGFASIFSPSGFKDEVFVRWLLYDPKRGWEGQDKIRMQILGGRELGFRGYTVKKNFQPGKWRFQVETSDGREVGRLSFRVYPEDNPAEPEVRTDIY